MKFYGKIGYTSVNEVVPGVWEEALVERTYKGDILQGHYSQWSNASGSTNDDLRISSRVSIVADAFALEHFSTIRYVELYGQKWKVSSVEPQRPRLILSLGGVYNETS